MKKAYFYKNSLYFSTWSALFREILLVHCSESFLMLAAYELKSRSLKFSSTVAMTLSLVEYLCPLSHFLKLWNKSNNCWGLNLVNTAEWQSSLKCKSWIFDIAIPKVWAGAFHDGWALSFSPNVEVFLLFLHSNKRKNLYQVALLPTFYKGDQGGLII